MASAFTTPRSPSPPHAALPGVAELNALLDQCPPPSSAACGAVRRAWAAASLAAASDLQAAEAIERARARASVVWEARGEAPLEPRGGSGAACARQCERSPPEQRNMPNMPKTARLQSLLAWLRSRMGDADVRATPGVADWLGGMCDFLAKRAEDPNETVPDAPGGALLMWCMDSIFNCDGFDLCAGARFALSELLLQYGLQKLQLPSDDEAIVQLSNDLGEMFMRPGPPLRAMTESLDSNWTP